MEEIESEKKGSKKVMIAVRIGFLGLVATILMTFITNWLFN